MFYNSQFPVYNKTSQAKGENYWGKRSGWNIQKKLENNFSLHQKGNEKRRYFDIMWLWVLN